MSKPRSPTIRTAFTIMALLGLSTLTNVGLADDKEDTLDKIRKNGKAEVHYTVNGKQHTVVLEKMTIGDTHKEYTDSEIAAMREVLKRKIKYKIAGKLYTMTDDDVLHAGDFAIKSNYLRLLMYPNSFAKKPYVLPYKEDKEEGLVSLNAIEWDNLRKGKTFPLVSQSLIEKTNNLSLYLSNSTDENGQSTRLGIDADVRIYRLRPNKEYSKKVDIIEDYYPIINQLAKLEMTEIKENLALSSIGVSFGLVLKKDFSEEVAELYFYSRNDHNFLVTDIKQRKFYHLQDEKRLLLNVFSEILTKH